MAHGLETRVLLDGLGDSIQPEVDEQQTERGHHHDDAEVRRRQQTGQHDGGGHLNDEPQALAEDGEARTADRNAPQLKGDLDFSFSGLKTAVLRYVRAHDGPLADGEVADICASFQRVVVTVLIQRAFAAARRTQARSIGVAGGVSANSRLRAELKAHGDAREMPTFVPSLTLSTDNAAMIAAAGLRKFRAGSTATLDLNADAALPL